MSAERLTQARRNAAMARARLETHLGALQHRLRPGNLAGEAWDGVKDKGADLADNALQAVRSRPAAVSMAVGALALFLAREPLKRAAARLFASADEQGEDDIVTTRIETSGDKFNMSAPIMDAPAKEGVV
jgi:hypothetical protein